MTRDQIDVDVSPVGLWLSVADGVAATLVFAVGEKRIWALES
jgi:hypothetical protein